MRLTTSLRSSFSMVAAALTLGGCAMPAQQGASTTASRLDAVQKTGVLRVCTPGDYRPFSFQKTDASYEGIDVDLMTAFSGSLGAKPEWIKTTWANLLPDLAAGKCDMAVGGVSVTTDRQKRAFFSAPYMVNGKTPIARCADVAKFQTVEQIDKPEVRVIFNPGGSNERFARANFKRAKLTLHGENVTIFDEILAHRADVSLPNQPKRSPSRNSGRGFARSTRTSRCSTAKWPGCCRATIWHSRRMSINGCTCRRQAATFSARWIAGSSDLGDRTLIRLDRAEPESRAGCARRRPFARAPGPRSGGFPHRAAWRPTAGTRCCRCWNTSR